MENSCLGWKFHSSLNSERFKCIRSSKQSSVVPPFTEITFGNVRIGFYSTPDWIENCCNWLFVSYIFTTLSSIQHCLLYNIVFITTLYSLQHCHHSSIVFITTFSFLQDKQGIPVIHESVVRSHRLKFYPSVFDTVDCQLAKLYMTSLCADTSNDSHGRGIFHS